MVRGSSGVCGRSAWLLVLLSLVLGACGGAQDVAVPPPTPPARSPFADLPTDAERCVLVRPGAASPLQRRTLQEFSTARDMAWQPGVVSWAEVGVGTGWRAVAELSVPAEEFAAASGALLVAEPGLESCPGECNGPRIWVLGPRRIGAGARVWHHFRHEPVQCEPPGDVGVVEQGRSEDSAHHRFVVGEHGFYAAREWTHPDRIPGLVYERFDGRLWEVRRFRGEDAELRAQDQRFRREAMLARAQAHRPMPIDRIRLHDVRGLRRQLELWSQEAADRGEAAQGELARLVSLIATAHADSRTLLLMSANACLSQQCASAVLPWLDAFVDEDLSDERIMLLRRWAVRDSEPSRLPALLEQDGVARDGAAAASMLARADNYEAAEAAWRADEALPSPRLTRASGRLPIATLHETLVALLDAAGGPLRVVYLRTDTEAPAEPAPVELPLLRVAWARGEGTREIGLVPLTRDISRAQAVTDGMRGSVTVTVALGDEFAPDRPLSIRGHVEGDEFVLDAASARYDWSAVRRFIADPLERLSGRLFPQPPYRFDASDAERAILEERARADESIACVAGRDGGSTFECAVSPERMSARRSMVEVVRPFLR